MRLYRKAMTRAGSHGMLFHFVVATLSMTKAGKLQKNGVQTMRSFLFKNIMKEGCEWNRYGL